MTDQAVRGGGPSPYAAGGFTGRVRELRELRADIERAGLHTLSGRPAPQSRVLLIAGRPGSGRTTLAEELARQLAGDYPDGVLRARLLDPGGSPVPIERTVRDLLGALGHGAAPPGADQDDLTAELRAALSGRRALLLLDDVHHPEQLLELLPDSRDCLVVAVAAGPLTGVPDVRPCTLGGLDRAASVELLRGWAGAAPRITVDPRRAESLAEACGDLPAALRLIGGWLAAQPKLSVSDATARLEAVPAPPEERNTDFLARAFRLVHASLPRSAARLLRLLALAPAGVVDAHTASALAGCGVDAAGAALEELTELGLLHHRTGEPATAGHGVAAHGAGGRAYAPPPWERCYTVPGCLDPLLRAALEAEERPAELMLARARMLERTVRRLQACWAVREPTGSPARKKLAGLPRELRFTSAAEAGRWLELRRAAILAAAQLAVAEGGGELDTLARRLIHALSRAFGAHRTPEESAPEIYRLHELVLCVAERRDLQRERTAALLNLADQDARWGRLEQAVTRYRAALDASRACGDHAAVARALESLGGAYAELGDWARAADWYDRALALRQTDGDLPSAARLHGRLGAAHLHEGRWGDALREWRAAAAVHRRLRDQLGNARALSEVARVLDFAGRPYDSLRTAQEALAAARRSGDDGLQAVLRLRLADACDRADDPVTAQAHRDAAEGLLGWPAGSTQGEESETSGDTSAIAGRNLRN
ncbi:tetratricopeptide repeat protein [Streptomyces sp. N2-109]|uniref:Tetratricopeptide repeat protein n=1 Tax=Streptomyces gossypii TaxID=2883101 RepID=A0ABT2JNX6_9ACTN|nr:tetratricopeptide repeat protein [Streptomyces gossypii]MCT2588969.1 tetratricopeptide repeat protein [Streptomyces gossypii]